MKRAIASCEAVEIHRNIKNNFWWNYYSISFAINQTTTYKMKISAILVVFICFIDGARLGLKGNMRGMTVDFSSMSPKEAAYIRHLIKQNCRKKYGRFASQFC